MASLSDKTSQDAAFDIAAGAAATYWLGQAASNDPDRVEHDGRIVPTVKVKNDREYAGVAAGQLAVAHFLWPIFGFPYIAVTLCLFVVAPPMWLSIHVDQHWGLLGIPLFFLWIYIFVWRIMIVWFFLERGPKIKRHENYQGVFKGLGK